MKKWMLIGLVVILIIGVAAYFLMNKNSGGSDNGNGNGTVPGVGNGDNVIGTIRVPGNDFDTKVVFTHPPQLKGEWQKPTISSLTIDYNGKITNVSGQAVSFDVYFLFDGKSADYLFPRTVQPGEIVMVKGGQLIASAWGAKVMEIKVTVTSASASPAPTTALPTAKPTVTPTAPPKPSPAADKEWVMPYSKGKLTVIYRASKSPDAIKISGDFTNEGDERTLNLWLETLRKIKITPVVKATRPDGKSITERADKYTANIRPDYKYSLEYFGLPHKVKESALNESGLNGDIVIEFWFVATE